MAENGRTRASARRHVLTMTKDAQQEQRRPRSPSLQMQINPGRKSATARMPRRRKNHSDLEAGPQTGHVTPANKLSHADDKNNRVAKNKKKTKLKDKESYTHPTLKLPTTATGKHLEASFFYPGLRKETKKTDVAKFDGPVYSSVGSRDKLVRSAETAP